MSSSSLQSQIAATLAANGVTVPPVTDETTLIGLVREALTPRRQRELTEVKRRIATLSELLEQLAAPPERLSGSLAWRAERRHEELRAKPAEAEDALVRVLQEEFYGRVIFNPVREARPGGADLLAFAAELLERHARGELPEPTAR